MSDSRLFDSLEKDLVSDLVTKYSLKEDWLLDYLNIQMSFCRQSRGCLHSDAKSPEKFVKTVYYCLDSAFGILGEKRAKELLYSETLETIYGRYVEFGSFRTRSRNPICRKDDMMKLLSMQVEILEDDKRHLIETGYAKQRLRLLPWLDEHVANLYFTKIAARITAKPDGKGIFQMSYTWPGLGETSRLQISSTTRFVAFAQKWNRHSQGLNADINMDYIRSQQNDTPVQIGSYGSARFLPNMTPDNAQYLEDSRPYWYECKLGILKLLTSNIEKNRSDEPCNESCFEILLRYTPLEAINELFELDANYYADLIYNDSKCFVTFDSNWGGIFDFLKALAHITNIHSIEYYDSICRFAEKELGIKFSLDEELPDLDYFEFVSNGKQQVADEFVDRLAKGNEKNDASNTKFVVDLFKYYEKTKLDPMLNNLFEVVQIERKVPHKDSAIFSAEMEGFADKVMAAIQKFDDLKQSEIDHFSDLLRSERFRDRTCVQTASDEWLIVFNGQECHLRNYVGLLFLRKLLGNPGKVFGALDLYKNAQNPKNKYDEDSQECSTELFPMRTEGFEALDEKAIMDYKERLKALPALIEDAKRRGDFNEMVERKDEMIFIRKELSRGINVHGDKRQIDNPAEKARVTVRKDIKKVIERIREKQYELADHLDLNISFGYSITYGTAESEPWIVDKM